jgi:hypothetical protein
MKSVRTGLWLALGTTLLSAVPTLAAEKPINISIFPPIAIAQPADGVSAFRLDLLYGKNTSVKFLDLGFINQTTSSSNGLQWGAINYNEGSQSGLQLGFVNYDKGSSNGLQWGTVNYAGDAGGLQLALINYAEKCRGFQVGAINIIKTGGMFPVMVIANWGKK